MTWLFRILLEIYRWIEYFVVKWIISSENICQKLFFRLQKLYVLLTNVRIYHISTKTFIESNNEVHLLMILGSYLDSGWGRFFEVLIPKQLIIVFAEKYDCDFKYACIQY